MALFGFVLGILLAEYTDLGFIAAMFVAALCVAVVSLLQSRPLNR